MTGFMTIADKAKSLGLWISTARNLAWLIVAFVVAVIVLSRYVGRTDGVVPSPFEIGLFAGGAALGGGVAWLAARRRFGLPEYSWVSAEYSLTFDEKDVLRQSQVTRVQIRILKDHVHLFRNRYSWTGQGSIRHAVISEGHRWLGEIRQEPNWRYYFVLLENPQPRGSTTTIAVRHDLYDSGRQSHPMVARDVVEPVEQLTLRAVFPTSARPARVIASEMVRSRSADAEWRVKWQEELPVVDVTGEVVYQPPKPVVGRRYQIWWEWPPTGASPVEGIA